MSTTHADGYAVLDRVRLSYGFLTDTDVALLAADPRTRLTPCLVRCGSGRFTTPAQDVAHFVAIIERDHVDYVRDVSIVAGT